MNRPRFDGKPRRRPKVGSRGLATPFQPYWRKEGAAEAEAELTARRAAPVLGFSAQLAFHARQCAVTPLFAAGAAPQALKKRPAPTARTCTEKCELAAGHWPLAT